MQGALKKIFQILKVNKKGVVNTIQDFVNNLKVRNTCNFQVVHKKKKKTPPLIYWFNTSGIRRGVQWCHPIAFALLFSVAVIAWMSVHCEFVI